ncbi:MAG: cell division topological specificity factor MinE [Oscillatoriales cyanobacterium SM2_2_1]|nr:cell division topological specificity factor MinE [Oscillatoriales cyanobacterium SM2_2_1]
MITQLLERLFSGRPKATSGQQVKQRLKFILAHDRAAISPPMFEAMRQEILAVVAKYVDLDEDSLEIRLESDNRYTAVVANMPIRPLRGEDPTEVAPEFASEELTLTGPTEPKLEEPSDSSF